MVDFENFFGCIFVRFFLVLFHSFSIPAKRLMEEKISNIMNVIDRHMKGIKQKMNLQNCNAECLNDKKLYIFDMDGTIYLGG